MANQISAKDFTAALESPFVRNMMTKTYAYLSNIGLNSVPAFVVNGKFIVLIDPESTVDVFRSVAFSLTFQELADQEAASGSSGS